MKHVIAFCLVFELAVDFTSTISAEPPPARARDDVAAVLAQAEDRRASVADARPLQVVLLADRKDHGPGAHDYPRWQSRWALLLGGTGSSGETAVNLHGPDISDPDVAKGAPGITVRLAQAWPNPDDWRTADLIVAFCYLSWNRQCVDQTRQFLQRGGGLVLIHSATWTKPQPSPDVAAIAGVGGFQRWRHGALEVEILALQHPICRGLAKGFALEDESYWPPTPALVQGYITALAGGKELAQPGDGTPAMQPLFWTHELGKGRVFGCVPGHFNWSFDDPYFRIMLLRGMAWAAGTDTYRFDPLVLRGARVR